MRRREAGIAPLHGSLFEPCARKLSVLGHDAEILGAAERLFADQDLRVQKRYRLLRQDRALYARRKILGMTIPMTMARISARAKPPMTTMRTASHSRASARFMGLVAVDDIGCL